MRSDGVRRVGDVAEIGFMILIEWSRHANDDGVHLLDLGVIRGGGKAFGLRLLDLLRRNAVDIRFALGQSIDLALIDVEAGDGKFLFSEQQGQWQSYVAEADDPNAGLTLLNPVLS